MSKILVESIGFEIRAAIIGAGRLEYLEIERTHHRSLSGNIYKGLVVRVLPGLNAAFVNIGEEREAFLPLTDVRETSLFEEEISEERVEKKSSSHRRLKVKVGDQLLVQVVKDAIGTKGPKVTANNISLVGFLAVLLPNQSRRGISRRITNPEKRERFWKVASEIVPDNLGFIIRTSTQNYQEKVLKAEMRKLLAAWEEVMVNFRRKPAPSLLRAEMALPLRILRDNLTTEVDEILVDSPFIFRSLKRRLMVAGLESKRLHLYRENIPLFTKFGVEEEIEKILSRKVNLENGGYITIEETEALCAIDVNSGRTTGEDYQSMVLRTNLAAAEEIAWQLRLRNLGGLIVIDFIDMEKAEDRRRVYQAFEKALEPDKARVKLLRFSKFGLVEMTRQRTRESIRDYLADDCPTCSGRGVVLSVETAAAQLRRSLQWQISSSRGLLRIPSQKKFNIRVSSQLEEYLKKNFRLLFPERIYQTRINLIVDHTFLPYQFRIMGE